MVDFDIVVEQQVADGLAFGRIVDNFAFRAEFGVWEYGYFRHVCSLEVKLCSGVILPDAAGGLPGLLLMF